MSNDDKHVNDILNELKNGTILIKQKDRWKEIFSTIFS